MSITALNPATGEVVGTYEETTPEEVDAALDGAFRAFPKWRVRSFTDRGACLRSVARLLREQSDELARLMALEMGKVLREGKAEIEKCAWVCDYYAEHAEEYLAPEEVGTDACRSFVTFQPLGLVLAVMPWNFPFWQVFRFAAPALMAGNVAILKHASNVPGCALAIERILHLGGVPENCFRTLLVGSGDVPRIIADERVSAVTLTGSAPAGKSVAGHAGSHLKKTVLELGGSDAYLVLEDADLELAVNKCAASRLLNVGQSCISAKRFIVVQRQRPQFERRFVERLRKVRIGDPLAHETEMGPLARQDLRDQLHRQVVRSIERGARCLLGGVVPEGRGAFYPPTVLTDVKKGSPAYEEELFGPVAAVIPVRDEEEAIRVANDTSFGLGAAVFTRNAKRGERIAAESLEAGCCFVNEFVRSDPRLPFGGIKESGYGRELDVYGIKEFVNIKTVYVA